MKLQGSHKTFCRVIKIISWCFRHQLVARTGSVIEIQ
jgi:hypothetical protein